MTASELPYLSSGKTGLPIHKKNALYFFWIGFFFLSLCSIYVYAYINVYSPEPAKDFLFSNVDTLKQKRPRGETFQKKFFHLVKLIKYFF